MDDLDNNIKVFEYLVSQQLKREQEIQELPRQGLPPGLEDESRFQLQKDIERFRTQLRKRLEETELFPSRHIRHQPKLQEFWADGTYEKSVFIMTKFPEGNTSKDKELKAVLKAISGAVKACGYVPRLASQKRYHPILWDNVELYLLGCQRGIAVVEDQYKQELNPNVAKEWGWMRGMGRDVLFLLESKFGHLRADWGGLLTEEFLWTSPNPAIRNAVEAWLK